MKKELIENKKNILISNKGISLTALIITIIIIIILSSIAIYYGYTKNIEQATITKMLNEFIEVENAVLQRGEEHKLDEEVYPYESKKAYTSGDTITINNITYGEGYHLVTPVELEKLGVTNVKNDFIVNYSTGEVILQKAFHLSGKDIYTKDDLIDAQTNSGIITQGEYDEEKGVNKPILLDGMLPVIYKNETWVVVSKNDKEWYDYSIDDSSGGPVRYANVMLLDDTTLRDKTGATLTNEEIRGKKIEDLVGAEVINEGSMFLWIPRFTFKEEDGTTKIVYSKLTSDYTQNGYLKNPAFYYGEYTGANSDLEENTGYVSGGKELTGIWISKYTAGYTN